MKEIKYKYIIWDWNGTLLNDVNASLDAVNDMLEERRMPPIDMARYKEIIGVPIRKFYERCFDLEKEDYNEILRQFNEGYLRHLTEYGLTEGVNDMLEYFKERKCRQIIVSSSNNSILKTNVAKYGIEDYFDAVLGSEGYLAESKVERAVDYIKRNGEGKSLVIGDLEHDAEMADAIGADCILITTGHDKKERLIESGATVIDRIIDIKRYV